MSFADSILTEELESLRQRLLSHPLWTGIEAGTVQRETLRVFALQDWWLVREAYHLDALAIVGVSDLDMQDLLLAKLVISDLFEREIHGGFVIAAVIGPAQWRSIREFFGWNEVFEP